MNLRYSLAPFGIWSASESSESVETLPEDHSDKGEREQERWAPADVARAGDGKWPARAGGDARDGEWAQVSGTAGAGEGERVQTGGAVGDGELVREGSLPLSREHHHHVGARREQHQGHSHCPAVVCMWKRRQRGTAWR